MSIWMLLYRMKKITAAQIWYRVDSGAISAEEAVKICGPRPYRRHQGHTGPFVG